MEEWRFVFEDNTSQDNSITSGIENTIGSGTSQKASTKSDKTEKKGFSQTVIEKSSEKLVEQTIVSPLNTVTGGFANPIYRTAKRLVSSGSVGVALGSFAVTVGVLALERGIEALQNRVATLEKQANQLNNNDNVLLRAGSVRQATYYTSNIFGIKKTTNRS